MLNPQEESCEHKGWSSRCCQRGGGTTLSCGAARLPETPTDFIDLALPNGLRPFDSLGIAALGATGASVFDNISVEQP
jgi:hypothetical protein